MVKAFDDDVPHKERIKTKCIKKNGKQAIKCLKKAITH